VSDCGRESKRVVIRHPTCTNNTYDFVDKMKNVSVSEKCLLITLDEEMMYTTIGHAKGLSAVREVLGSWNILNDAVVELLDLSLKTMSCC